jgi:hypothetical protein
MNYFSSLLFRTANNHTFSDDVFSLSDEEPVKTYFGRCIVDATTDGLKSVPTMVFIECFANRTAKEITGPVAISEELQRGDPER